MNQHTVPKCHLLRLFSSHFSKLSKPLFYFLLDLPNELIVHICQYLTKEKDTSNFSRCSRRLHTLLTADLYRHNILHYAGSALLWAAQHGQAGTVKRMLKYGADPNVPVEPGTFRPPLSVAISAGHLEITELLLSSGKCDFDKSDRVNVTPLTLAVSQSSPTDRQSFVELLLRHGAGATDTPSLRSALLIALSARRAETVQLLLAESTLDLNTQAQNREKYTLFLFAALASKSPHILSLMLAREDVDVNVTNSQGNTALMVAARDGMLNATKALIARGALPHAVNHQSKTALHLAAGSGYNRVVSALLDDHRVDIECRSDEGSTPLMAAIEGKHDRTVRLLLRRGANPNSTDHGGCSALTVAAMQGRELIVKTLLAYKGIKADIKDHAGRTPLSYAATYSHLEAVKMLLARGSVDPDSRCNSGGTPLLYAAFYTFGGKWPAKIWEKTSQEGLDTIHVLLETGRVNVNTQDRFGRTVLSYVAEAGRDDLARILIKKGAEANLADNQGMLPLEYARRNFALSQDEKVSRFQRTIELVKKNSRSATAKTVLLSLA